MTILQTKLGVTGEYLRLVGITARVSTYCQPEAFSRNELELAIFTISKISNISTLDILGMVLGKVRHLVQIASFTWKSAFTTLCSGCPGAADGVVWSTEGAMDNELLVGPEQARHAVNGGSCQGFLETHGGQDGGDASGQHGLSGSWRTYHQQVVSAGAGHFQGPFGPLLALDMGKVETTGVRLAQQSPPIDSDG